MSKAKSDAIEKIEFQLLSALLQYAVPFINKKIKPNKDEKRSKLEEIANEAPKISFNDIRELEKSLLEKLNSNIKTRKNIKVESGSLFYSLSLGRKKDKGEKINNYSISIKYEEGSSQERLKVSIKADGKEVYSAENASEKAIPDKVRPYSVVITYEDNYAEERLKISYKQQLKSYMKQHMQEKEDMTNRVPLKWLNILPETIMGGVLGFTYLGENFMGRRADLVGKTARMVDIHESIHTPDEYETRVLTSWIMEKARGKYIK